MSMSISLRRGAQTAATEHTADTQSTQSTQSTHRSGGSAGAERSSAGRPQDTVVGQRLSPEQARLQQLANGGAQSSASCRAAPSESALVDQYRATIAAGGTVHIPEAPPLPTRSGASLRQELRIPAPALPSGTTQLIQQGSAPITGLLVPRIAHGVEAVLHRHASSLTHLGIDLGAHSALLAAELHHLALLGEHGALVGTTTSAAGAAALSFAGTLLTADATIGAVIETAIRMNNGTLPTPESIRQLLIERGPEFVAAMQAAMDQQLESSFRQGALAAARGEAPPAGSDPAFRRGFAAGIEYRREHGCAFDEHERSLRALNTATRGTARDASAGFVSIHSAQVERGPAGLVDREAFYNRALAE